MPSELGMEIGHVEPVVVWLKEAKDFRTLEKAYVCFSHHPKETRKGSG